MLIRKGSFDSDIWKSVQHDYAIATERLVAGDVVLDIGCHIGAFSVVAADRGARVVGIEANRENYALACINTREWPSIEIRFGAVWRSDQEAGALDFQPAERTENTGGGSVLFQVPLATASGALTDVPSGVGGKATPYALSRHTVPAIPLDSVLAEFGRVRLLKIDAEGSEFPILLTATRLDQVEMIVGEYHEVAGPEMLRLAPCAQVGVRSYTKELLAEILADAGFRVRLIPTWEHQGLFFADRS